MTIKRHIALVSILWNVLLPNTTFPQQPGSDPFLVSIRAHGELALQSVQVIVITGQATSGNKTEPITISATLDGKIRVDYGQPLRRSLVTSPQGSFEATGGGIRPRSPHAVAFGQLDRLFILSLRDLSDPRVRRSALGPGSLQGRATQRFKVETGRQQVHYRRVVRDEVEVQFDQQTGLVAGVVRQQYADESLDRPFVSAYRFSDYRNVEGLLFPFRIERYIDGLLRETVVVETVRINVGLANGLFER